MKKEIAKTVIVLSVIALISGLLLGLLNEITKVDAEAKLLTMLKSEYSEEGEFKEIEIATPNKDIKSIGKINKAYKSSGNMYALLVSGKGGFNGDVQMLIAIKDNEIKGMNVFSASETPGLGTKVLNEDYFGQYVGMNIENIEECKLAVSESGELIKYLSPAQGTREKMTASDDGSIMAVTGATKTSNALINSVNVAIIAYNHLKVVDNG